jgi:hypothetical protein
MEHAMANDPFVPSDPIETAPPPERVNYATGVLLDAADFRDEQTYHRGRLARVLRYLAGFGTVAGLRVVPPAADDGDLELRVQPGLAIDRYGRLIEIQGAQCIGLARWFDAQSTALLRSAVQRAPRVTMAVAVVVDVFLSAHDCARAKTPAFAAGPFDALDAVVPARLADSHRLELVPRAEGPPDPIPTPSNFWPDPMAEPDAAARRGRMLQAVLGSWDEGGADGLEPLAEHVEGHDAAAVLLARVSIPIVLDAAAPAGTRPQLRLDERVSVDNSLRPFVSLSNRWVGRAIDVQPLVQP